MCMNQSQFVTQIQNPGTYGYDASTKVEMIQTHISFVILVDNYAFKIKKPVNFGFLDFSTRKKRKMYCEKEIQLNNRLCPEIYDSMVSFSETEDGHLTINGNGPVVDYAVKMHRFDQNKLMNELLTKQKITKTHIEHIADILVGFYEKQTPSQTINKYGSVSSVKQNIDENFEQTREVVDVTIPKNRYDFIKQINESFFQLHSLVLERRKKQGCIFDCHGDLHSGNIVIDKNNICIFDCIEFNTRFRYIDVASDIGFLAMDLDFHNHPFLSSHFILDYVHKSDDDSLFDVLNFYKSYRAYVRGKVIGFQLTDEHISSQKKQSIIETAQQYFALSEYYIRLVHQQYTRDQPVLFLIGGLTGTGKSTLASKIAVDYQATILNTDIIRKDLAGIDRFERHHDEPNTGLYAPERVKATYEKLMDRAMGLLKKGDSVVLDATFQKRIYREKAYRLAQKNNAIFIPIECICPETIAAQWLQDRLKQKTVSDGRWEIYQQQKQTFESFAEEENHIVIDMANEDYSYRLEKFNEIVSWMDHGEKQ